MVNILLVDDEPIVCMAIQSLMDWQAHGFSVQLAAFSGKQALEILKQHPEVEIVVTDISMPGMTGLELIEKIHAMGLDPVIVVLSAFDDYQLVRQAFRLGAIDYVLKNNLEPEMLCRLFENALEQQKKDAASPVQAQNENRQVAARWLHCLTAKENEDKPSLPESLKNTGSRFGMAILLLEENGAVLPFLMQPVEQTLVNIMVKHKCGEVLNLMNQEFLLLFALKENLKAKILSQTEEILREMEFSLINFTNLHFTCGVSEFVNCNELEQRGIELLAHARNCARYGAFHQQNSIIYYEKLQKSCAVSPPPELEYKIKLHEALRNGDEEQFRQTMKDAVMQAEKQSVLRKEDFNAPFLSLVTELHIALAGEEEMRERIDYFSERLSKTKTLTETKRLLEELTEELSFRQQKQLNANIKNHLIQQALIYIRKNSAMALSLQSVSAAVGLSESYFSSLFSQTVHSTFSQYLNKVRIEKAKELLLDSNYRINEIAYQIGYQTEEHFHRVFRKFTGQTPKEFQRTKGKVK